MASYNNQGRQTELVKSALVSYIKDNRLSVGDRIPTQVMLRRMLGVGNAVIGRAIKALADDGILESRGRNGVVVVSTSTDGYQGRNIGIICHRNTEYAVSAVLLQSLAISLNDQACQITLFNKNSSEKKDSFALCEFDGVLKAIERKQVSGLLSTMLLDDASVEFCKKNDIPLVYVGVSSPNASGICFDSDMEECFVYAQRRGYRRPMYVHMGHPETERHRREFAHLAEKYTMESRHDLKEFCRFICENGDSSWRLEDSMNSVRQLVRDIRRQPLSKRPDILIVPDDMIAAWLAQEISRDSWDVEILHTEIRQLGYSWPLRSRGSYFLIDCHDIAELTVKTLLNLIQGRKGPQKVFYAPAFIEMSSPRIGSTKRGKTEK